MDPGINTSINWSMNQLMKTTWSLLSNLIWLSLHTHTAFWPSQAFHHWRCSLILHRGHFLCIEPHNPFFLCTSALDWTLQRWAQAWESHRARPDLTWAGHSLQPLWDLGTSVSGSSLMKGSSPQKSGTSLPSVVWRIKFSRGLSSIHIPCGDISQMKLFKISVF